MTELNRRENVIAFNERALQELAWTIENSEGEFSLIFAHCNYARLREQVTQRLQEKCSVKIAAIVLSESDTALFTTIAAQLDNEYPPALMILGLELVINLDNLLISLNQVREEFRKRFPFALVLWVNDEVLQKLMRLAPDFESWGTTINFEFSNEELIDLLRQEAEVLFTTFLKTGTDSSLVHSTSDLNISSQYRWEVELALRDLHSRELALEPDLEASLQFLLGRNDYASGQIDSALSHCQHSLAFWQHSNNWEWQGVLLFQIGLCYSRHAERHGTDKHRYWQEARGYLLQCLDVFERAQRSDLVARFISHLGEVLQHLEAWDELQLLAQKSLGLHQNYGSNVQLAQDYGFLAEVGLVQSRYLEAHQLAEQALQILAQATNIPLQAQSFYLLLLAQSQRHLGQFQEALIHLEKARVECSPQHDPQLYIRILAELRSLYFQQGEYLKAFEIKQEQRSIEYQYGFRSFIGVEQLQPQVKNTGLVQGEQQITVAPELTASGRQVDVNRLIERIARFDSKLTVIHGPSGVGKSSIVSAGLVPALKQKVIGSRDILPIVLRVYTNWLRELETALAEMLETVKGKEFPESLYSVATVLEQLRRNTDRNLLTVLIFDQFEEFFFVCNNLTSRRLFWAFLRDCLNIPYIKVILSIREDYLHYLLEWERSTNLDIINNNILDKHHRYYLGNLTPEDAKSLIESITEHSQFYLETALIDVLVSDLAGEWGEVRPIELQLVGTQLQTEKITTLAQYMQIGSKSELIQRFLEVVVKDCGFENELAAWIVLYSLTDENGSRPLKTYAELAKDLADLAVKLDLVLNVLVGSGLVLLLPEVPADRYQLVPDYLVSYIRRRGELNRTSERKNSKRLKRHNKFIVLLRNIFVWNRKSPE